MSKPAPHVGGMQGVVVRRLRGSMSEKKQSVITSGEAPAVIFLTFVAWAVLLASILIAVIIWTNEPDSGTVVQRAETISGVAWLLGGVSACAVMLVLCEIANSLGVLVKRQPAPPPALNMRDL